MFQNLAAQLNSPDLVFLYRPSDLLEYLERCWEAATVAPWLSPALPQMPALALTEVPSRARPYRAYDRDPLAPVAPMEPVDPGFPYVLPQSPQNLVPPIPPQNPEWLHLIYAFAIENTRIVEVFRRVLEEIVIGERLGRPNWQVQRWARNTEELFFSNRLGSSIFGQSMGSAIRPDAGAIRRNAYHRMFGMDLSHGLEDGRPYQFKKVDAANRPFVREFEALLRETWRAHAYLFSVAGPNPTDPMVIGDLCERLQNMLMDRRLNGSLAQEEFTAVSMLSWLHLTVSANTQVVQFLQADGTDPSGRLQSVGQKVGLPAHSRALNYFEMAVPLSQILWLIEMGTFTPPNGVLALYGGGVVTDLMLTIINNWSAATGRNLKEFIGDGAPASRRVTISGVPA